MEEDAFGLGEIHIDVESRAKSATDFALIP
jgi:hypothetical protein